MTRRTLILIAALLLLIAGCAAGAVVATTTGQSNNNCENLEEASLLSRQLLSSVEGVQAGGPTPGRWKRWYVWAQEIEGATGLGSDLVAQLSDASVGTVHVAYVLVFDATHDLHTEMRTLAEACA